MSAGLAVASESDQPASLDQHSDEDEGFTYSGDYSSRMEEILGGETKSDGPDVGEEDEDEGFVYQGVDTEPQGPYRDQLRAILDAEHEDDELEEREVDTSLRVNKSAVPDSGPARVASEDLLSDNPSSPSLSQSTTSPRPKPSPLLNGRSPVPSPAGTPSRLARPFLHPTISRLRSHPARRQSTLSVGSTDSVFAPGVVASPALSHLSALSGNSSSSNLPEVVGYDTPVTGDRVVFKWTRLRQIEEVVFGAASSKAAAVLGAADVGTPTVLVVNSMICLGTSSGKVLVLGFKQTIQCVCGNDASAKAAGSVTAVALSHDHTFVASGHISGYILLYDLKHPGNPVRTVTPVSLASVRTGRHEGHIVGSRIINIGFIAGRHTAMVSADDRGLSFYHSLGKVLFVEANDTLRILGKYPDDPVESTKTQLSKGSISSIRPSEPDATPPPLRRRRQQAANAILAMYPLPLGAVPHSTDAYQVVAVLTPVKLVVVGLKPTAKTWYRRHRPEETLTPQSRWQGCMAWFPSMSRSSEGPMNASPENKGHDVRESTSPLLAHSWGDAICVLMIAESRTHRKVQNPRNGQVRDVEEGILTFEERPSWKASGFVIGLQWLGDSQVVVLTATSIEIYDVRTRQMIECTDFDAATLVNPQMTHDQNASFQYAGNVGDVAHSIRVFKGRIFILGQRYLQVGTLLTWADRILHCVEEGDFLGAIDLACSYYTGEAPGNRNGLPENALALQNVVGVKISELLVASAKYAFSEDRLTDATHSTPDGRGVDRTSLFEGLVSTTARACVSLHDTDFLFEDLYQYYEDWGIESIFLRELERFVLDGSIHTVPPRVTQRLVAMLAEQGTPDRAEKVIWRIDPLSLDIDQVILLCHQYKLYDALIYVYTSAMKDYQAPIVELLGLLRTVQQHRRAVRESPETTLDEDNIDLLLINGYKIFPYLSNVLSGLAYPGQDPLPFEEATRAREDVYTFLFSGRSKRWPETHGKLVLTSEAEGGPEPTYPYVRLLLKIDTEAFLHTLDIAFEDAYLSESYAPTNHTILVKILLEVLASSDALSTDATLINIFVARNVPKYTQSIYLESPILQQILVDLAEGGDDENLEDRQLAAEYLLSAYTPHQKRQLVELFERAGFFRILRRWHRQDRQWGPLMATYIKDAELGSPEMFQGVSEALSSASKPAQGMLPQDVLVSLEQSISILLQADVRSTAILLDIHASRLHERAVNSSALSSDRWRLEYLRPLLARPSADSEGNASGIRIRQHPANVPQALCHRFISLQCQYEQGRVRDSLEYLPEGSFEWDQVIQICQDLGVYDVAVWAVWRSAGAQPAIERLTSSVKSLTASTLNDINGRDEQALTSHISAILKLTQEGVSVCAAVSQESVGEDLWFRLLDGQVHAIQTVASLCASLELSDDGSGQTALSSLRPAFHQTFASLMSAQSDHISLPRVFKRLVDSATKAFTVKSAAYAEFRTVLTGLLDAYRSDADNAIITANLVNRDLFDAIEERTAARSSGWAPHSFACATCKKVIVGKEEDTLQERIIISRTGLLYHASCVPPS